MRLYDKLIDISPKHVDIHSLGGLEAKKKLVTRLSVIGRRSVLFKIEDDVLEAAIRLAFDHPDVLADFSRRARLPYDSVFLEWNNRSAVEISGKIGRHAELAKDAPEFCGALCQRGADETFTIQSVVSAPAGEGTEKLGVNPFAVFFSPDLDIPRHHGHAAALFRGSPALERDGAHATPRSVWEKDYLHHITIPIIFGGFPWQGKEYDEAPVQWEAARSISRRMNVIFNEFERNEIVEGLNDYTDKTVYPTGVGNEEWGPGPRTMARRLAVADMLGWSVRETFGFHKIVLGVLSLMNAKDRLSVWSEPAAPAGKFYSRGKYRPFSVSRTVTLKLPLAKVMRRARVIAFQYMQKRRRHRVIGHWCSSNLRGDPNCNHVYVDVNPRLKECRCGHRCWWRVPCERGDAGLGWVNQEYEVSRRTAA